MRCNLEITNQHPLPINPITQLVYITDFKKNVKLKHMSNRGATVTKSGIGIGTIVALCLSIWDNVVNNNHLQDLFWNVVWVVINTLCSWFYVISFVITHL
jgi:hypothetical protein